MSNYQAILEEQFEEVSRLAKEIEMNPEKDIKQTLSCVCGTRVPNNSKYRGRFLRRHRGSAQKDPVCMTYAAQKRIEDPTVVKSTEGGTRVNMS